MPTAFTGTLNTNEFYNGLFNAYRLIYTVSDGRDFSSLADMFRVDGGRYADKSVFTDMDVLMSRPWDPEDGNILASELTVTPKQQQITVNQKRQIAMTSEQYLSKRAWMDPSVFDEFNGVVQAQVRNTKRLHEQRLINVFIGTTTATGTKAASGSQNITVDVTTAVGETTGEEKNRITAQKIMASLADLFADLEDSTRNYTDNGFMKAYPEDSFMIIWNSAWYNSILNIDLPTVFHDEGLKRLLMSGKKITPRYFGAAVTTSVNADGTTNRASAEYAIRVNASGEYAAAGTAFKNVFPGDLLPKGTPIVAPGTAETSAKVEFTVNGRKVTVHTYSTVHSYVADPTVICKVIHKDSVKYLSSFETETEFWNPKNLRTNRYLTWMYADPEYLAAYPFITVTKI